MNSDRTSGVSVTSCNEEKNISILNNILKLLKEALPLLPIYLLGYFGFSILWICGIFFIIIIQKKRKQNQIQRRNVLRAMALGEEKQIILQTLKEKLPFWVNFPDIEKIEWLNIILKQIWESMNRYIQDLIPEVIEPAIQNYVADFKFDHIVLGNVPLRIDGVKVFDQESDNKIMMDIDISYVGDCYITFQTYKFTGGIKNIQLHGKIRIVLTPLISKLPIIGGLQIYFISEPQFDFDLIKVTQILDMPLIRNKIKNTIMNVINAMFLFPNIYTIGLSEGINMSKLVLFRPEDVLRVHVIEAKDLVNKDLIGKSDPYVVLSIGSRKIETHIISNSLNPKWDFWAEIETEANAELQIEVWDHDEGTKDETLGKVQINISQIAKKGEDDLWLKLQDVVKGTIHIRLTWLSLSSNYADLDDTIKEVELLSQYLHTSLFIIYLESANNLLISSKSQLPKPYILIEVENKIEETETIPDTCNPVWNKGFTFMVRNPTNAILNMKVWDEEVKKEIGECSFKIDELKNARNMEIRNYDFILNNKQSYIRCSMMLRIFKNENLNKINGVNEEETTPKSPRKILEKQESSFSLNSTIISQSEESSLFLDEDFISNADDSGLGSIKITLKYSMERQKLLVTIHEVTDIPHKHSSHFPNPYVKLYLISNNNKNKKNKQKSRIIKDNCNPVFNENFEFLISARDIMTTRLLIIVANDQNIFSIRKKILGHFVIDLGKYENLTTPLTHSFNLKHKNNDIVYYLTS